MAACADGGSEAVNLGSGEEISIGAFFNLIA